MLAVFLSVLLVAGLLALAAGSTYAAVRLFRAR